MNPEMTTQTQTTLESIRRYLNENPRVHENHSIDALGMTPDRRIVQLADSPNKDRRELCLRLKQQLLPAFNPEASNPSGATIKDAYKILTEYSETQEKLAARKITATNRPSPEAIGKILKTLEENQKKEFEALNQVTTTNILDKYPNRWVTRGKGDLRKSIKFENSYNKQHWMFFANFKNKDYKNVFYMSNVVAQQFKMCFEHNGWDLTLPETITRHNIINECARNVIDKHKKNFHSKTFMDEFLKDTVNGKSTKHITNALGMEIDKLEVMQDDDVVASLSDNYKYSFISVVVHTSPDWNIYGEMD